MKRPSLVIDSIAVLLGGLLSVTATTAAQNAVDQSDNTQQQVQNRNSTTQREVRRPNLRTQRGDAMQQRTVRASQVLGHNIVNTNNENVGEINDLVLDPMNGRIRYAAVTYGGFVGIGDKMFAVPWEAFECRQNTDDPDEHVIVLNVSQEQLEDAQGFDQDNWPNFADRNFTSELDRRYGVERRDRVDRNRGGVGVDVNRNGVDVDVDRN